MNIEDAETDRLARKRASATGETITVAARFSGGVVGDQLLAIVERGRARALRDTRSADEIVDYDEHGLPG
ncbi:MAG: PSK operon transcription factor [Mobilicoccus sp.]|nr:PSK operon transcription factor [Mobilicoccus sp.]